MKIKDRMILNALESLRKAMADLLAIAAANGKASDFQTARERTARHCASLIHHCEERGIEPVAMIGKLKAGMLHTPPILPDDIEVEQIAAELAAIEGTINAPVARKGRAGGKGKP